MNEKLYIIAVNEREARHFMQLRDIKPRDANIITRSEQLRGLSIDRRRVLITDDAARLMSEDVRSALTMAQERFIARDAKMTADAEKLLSRPMLARGSIDPDKDYTLVVSDPKGHVIFERKVTAEQLRELPV